MDIEIITSFLAALLSLVAGFLSVRVRKLIEPEIRKFFRLPEKKKSVTFAERLHSLTQKLDGASREVDEVLLEIALVAKNRQETVETLEKDLHQLETKERQLKGRIEALENTPVEAAEHFASLISAGEKRSAKRDYFLFGGGVLLTTTIALAIQSFAG